MVDSANRATAMTDDVEAARGSVGTDPQAADLAVSVVGRLFRLAPQLTDLLDLGAREYGMGFARGRVLWALQESGPVVMRALSQQLGISPRTVTGLIDALEADGWVTRAPHPDDRRATIIAITPAAEAALSVLRESYEGLAHDLLDAVDPDDLARCQSVLGTIQDRLATVIETRMAAAPPPTKPRPRAAQEIKNQLARKAPCLTPDPPFLLGVEPSTSLALAARVMAVPQPDDTMPSRRRMRQLLEAEATLVNATGLAESRPTPSGRAVLELIAEEGIPSSRAPWQDGEALASMVRDGLGMGRAPIADVADLAERHFGLDVLAWPTGTGVSGLCAHGRGVVMMLVSTAFTHGRQRFTTAHELAHHLLRDPREVVIDSDLYDGSNPMEKRANAFAAALLMPAEGLRDVIAARAIDAAVVTGLMRHFGVSYSALLYRLANPERWLA
jgi:DNA-binding MarR family transcriptional regulator/Zn-dependent peptidase ImmA (M78 family)